jgi:serine/threonine protein phosphatase PrpC
LSFTRYGGSGILHYSSSWREIMQDNLQVNSAAITDKGLSEKRPQNEDSYLELRDSGLYAVADGVGGAQAGDVASQMAMEILGEAFINLQEDGDAEERMKAAIDQANGAIYQMSNELSQLSTMATTIVALHLSGNIATIGHVGDSRLYRLDENGNLYRETQDHSVVEEEVRAGRMTPEQALTHPSRNVISRALGAEQTVEIDMKTIMFEPNTKFLICSDGVTRHIPDEELKSLLTNEDDNFLICQQIKEICYDRGAEDNLTAVIVTISAAAAPAFAGTEAAVRDYEEDTVATARPPLVNSAVFGGAGAAFDGEVQSPPVTIREDRNTDSGDEQTAGDDDFSFAESRPGDTITISTRDHDGDSETISERSESGGGIVGKVISGLVWLLIGAVLGAVGFYFGANRSLPFDAGSGGPNVANEQILSFEQKRRTVDANPAQYAAQYVNPETPEDHYFLGRANYLNGQFETARTELEKAQSRLVEMDEVNRKIVENEIAWLLENITGKGQPNSAKSPAATGRGAATDSPGNSAPAEGLPAGGGNR